MSRSRGAASPVRWLGGLFDGQSGSPGAVVRTQVDRLTSVRITDFRDGRCAQTDTDRAVHGSSVLPGEGKRKAPTGTSRVGACVGQVWSNWPGNFTPAFTPCFTPAVYTKIVAVSPCLYGTYKSG